MKIYGLSADARTYGSLEGCSKDNNSPDELWSDIWTGTAGTVVTLGIAVLIAIFFELGDCRRENRFRAEDKGQKSIRSER